MKPYATFLHLSDTHLGEEFSDAGGPHRERVRGVLDGGRLIMQAHDSQILLLLPLEVDRLFKAVRQRDQVMWGPEYEATDFFDRVILSGDISTDATSPERFAFAHGYVTGTVQAAKTGYYASQGRVGLQIPPGRLLCVPGNHDKMREKSLDRFHSAFAQAPSPCNYVRFVRRYGRCVVFFGMDSNEYGEGTIARGEIDASRLAWLVNSLSTIEKAGLESDGDRMTAEEFQTSVRCLILHHHVADLSYRRGFILTNPFRSFTVLNGAEKLLDVLAGRIDVVFHGHEHYPVCFSHASGALIISAGTTSEWHQDAYNNSFYVVTFHTNHTVTIDEQVWTGRGFSNIGKNGKRLRRDFPLPRLQELTATERSA